MEVNPVAGKVFKKNITGYIFFDLQKNTLGKGAGVGMGKEGKNLNFKTNYFSTYIPTLYIIC